MVGESLAYKESVYGLILIVLSPMYDIAPARNLSDTLA